MSTPDSKTTDSPGAEPSSQPQSGQSGNGGQQQSVKPDTSIKAPPFQLLTEGSDPEGVKRK